MVVKQTSRHRRPTKAADSTKGLPGSPVLQSSRHTQVMKKQDAWRCPDPLPERSEKMVNKSLDLMSRLSHWSFRYKFMGKTSAPLASLNIVPSILVCCESQQVAKNVTTIQKDAFIVFESLRRPSPEDSKQTHFVS